MFLWEEESVDLDIRAETNTNMRTMRKEVELTKRKEYPMSSRSKSFKFPDADRAASFIRSLSLDVIYAWYKKEEVRVTVELHGTETLDRLASLSLGEASTDWEDKYR